MSSSSSFLHQVSVMVSYSSPGFQHVWGSRSVVNTAVRGSLKNISSGVISLLKILQGLSFLSMAYRSLLNLGIWAFIIPATSSPSTILFAPSIHTSVLRHIFQSCWTHACDRALALATLPV
jgi:hypothetical protein